MHYGISNFFRRLAMRLCLVACVVGSLVSPARAQQYIHFSYNGTGLASGEDATVKYLVVTYDAKIERQQVSGSTHFILTVLGISVAGNNGTWSPDPTKDPFLLINGSAEKYPSQTYDLGTASTVTVSVGKQIVGSSTKYHFGQQTNLAVNPPKVSETQIAVNNPINKALNLEIFGIKADGSLVSISKSVVQPNSSGTYTVKGDATLYPGGVSVLGTYTDAVIDGSGNVVDGSGTNVAFSLGKQSWQLPVDYDPTGTAATASQVDTSATGVPAQVVDANTTNNTTNVGGASYVTNNNLYNSAIGSPTTTTGLTVGAAQVIGNGIINAVNQNAQTVSQAIGNIKVNVSGGSGGSTDMTATNAKLDTANTKLEDLKTKADSTNTKLDTLHTDLTTANTDLATALASGIATAGGITSAVNGVIGSETTRAASDVGTRASGIVAPSAPSLGSDSVQTSTISVGTNSFAAFELNPAINTSLPAFVSDMIAWVRAMIGWGAVAGLYSYAGRSIRRAIGTVILTQAQSSFAAERAANSNAVTAAGSLTLRVALIAALLAVFVAMPSAFIQLFSTDWRDLLNTFAGTIGAPGSGSAESKSMFAIANDFAPLATLFSVGATYVVFEWVLLPLQVVWQFASRFCGI